MTLKRAFEIVLQHAGGIYTGQELGEAYSLVRDFASKFPLEVRGSDGKVYEPTGEIRNPKRGEWFMATKGEPNIAAVDFESLTLPILREITPASPDMSATDKFALVQGLSNMRDKLDGLIASLK
jgi:hypothetical protein